MSPQLSPALIEEILFAMEDFKQISCFNTERFCVERLASGQSSESSTRVPLPSWTSADGYGLMESFAASPGAELLREDLLKALGKKQGVFRAYKDVLSANEVLKERWHIYKREALLKRLTLWFDALCEASTLERMGREPEETEEILHEDFTFVWVQKRSERLLSAYSPSEILAGTIAIDMRTQPFRIAVLHVEPEYRAMGLGTSLLEKALDSLSPVERRGLEIEVPQERIYFSRALERLGFFPRSVSWAFRGTGNVGENLE